VVNRPAILTHAGTRYAVRVLAETPAWYCVAFAGPWPAWARGPTPLVRKPLVKFEEAS
jgi:hypothetical protein